MSLKKIQQVKKDRGFALFDLIIYGVLIAVVAALFVGVFTAFNREPLTGVRVSVRAEAVFEFTFGGQLSVLSEDVTYDEDSKGITVTVQSDDGFNVIYIDKQNRSVKMKQADCNGRQCLFFRAMTDNSQFIYCNPHAIKIEPIDRDLDSPDIII